MTRKRSKSQDREILRAAIGAPLGVAAAILKGVGKLIATIWRIAGALDSALWHGFRHIAHSILAAAGLVIRTAWGGVEDFARWLPSRAGRAYSALSGVVLIVSGLWITDELVLAPDRFAGGPDLAPSPPVDEADPILARVGGRYVHLSDVSEAARSSGALDDGEVLTPAAAFSRGLVENYVRQRLLAHAALEEGIHRKGATAQRLGLARDRILAAAYLDKRIDAVVTSEAVRNFYNSQAGVTLLGDEVRARHIVVRTREEAYIILLALEDGEDFAELAKEWSIDRSTAPLGGEIGYFTKDMVTPVLADAAFTTEPGSLAPLFVSEFGWHVLEVLDRRPTRGVGFDSVKPNIERFLRMRTIEAALEELERKDEVVYYGPPNEPAQAGALEEGAEESRRDEAGLSGADAAIR